MMLIPTIATVSGGRPPRARRGDRDDVGERAAAASPNVTRGRHDERGAADDQREREEERALVAAGQHDEERRERDRDAALEDELRGSERAGGQQVVDDEDEQAGRREQGEDRRLGLAPEPGHRDDRRGREDEDPATRSGRPGRRRPAARRRIGEVIGAARRGRPRARPLAIGRVDGRASRRERSAPAEQRRQDDAP